MGALLLVLIAAYFLIRPGSANEVSADAAATVQNDPINPIDTGQMVQGAEQQVRVDLTTGKVVTSAVGIGTAVGAGIAGAAESGTFIALSATSWTVIGAAIAGLVAL